jgi:putative transposase
VTREQDLAGAQPAAYRVTTRQEPGAQAAPDLLCRDFTSLDRSSVATSPTSRTWAGWAYLAVVLDLATKMIVGWQISNRASARLCVDALEIAERNGHLQADAIFQSDMGIVATFCLLRDRRC